jgi:hypothetical protein
MNENCYYNDHDWHGGGACVHCGERLRCFCGQFVTESSMRAHLESCRNDEVPLMAIIHYELPDDLHRALKIRAAEEGVTLKALIIRYLELGLGVERELTE